MLRRNTLPRPTGGGSYREMVDDHFGLRRAQNKLEDEPHRAVTKLHVELNDRCAIPIEFVFCSPAECKRSWPEEQLDRRVYDIVNICEDVGDVVGGIYQPQFGSDGRKAGGERARRSGNVITTIDC